MKSTERVPKFWDTYIYERISTSQTDNRNVIRISAKINRDIQIQWDSVIRLESKTNDRIAVSFSKSVKILTICSHTELNNLFNPGIHFIKRVARKFSTKSALKLNISLAHVSALWIHGLAFSFTPRHLKRKLSLFLFFYFSAFCTLHQQESAGRKIENKLVE